MMPGGERRKRDDTRQAFLKLGRTLSRWDSMQRGF